MGSAEDEVDLLLVGECAALGPLRSDLARLYARWWNDPEVRRGLLSIEVWNVEAAERWVAEVGAASAAEPPTQANFTVYAAADREPVGTTALMRIDHHNKVADFGLLIGARRGEGFGTDAARLVLRWAFEILRLENVLLSVLPSNVAGIRAYEKAGFRVIGARRRAAAALGGREDEILMDAVPGDPAAGGPTHPDA